VLPTPSRTLVPYTTLFRSFTLRWRIVTIFHLDLTQGPIELTKALVDIPSPSHHEKAIADAIEQALKPLVDSADVELARFGNTVRSEEHTSELQSRFELVCR